MTLVTTGSHIGRNSGRLPDDSEWGLQEKAAFVFECLDVSENTCRQYQREVKPFLQLVADRDGHIGPTTLLDWKRRLGRRADIGTATKRKYLNVARVLLRELHRWGVIPDFTKGVKSFQVTRVHKRTPITDEELERLWEYLDSAADTRTRAIIGLLYYQGLRRIEVTRLRVEDIHRDTKTLLVHGKGRDDKEPCDLHTQMVTLLVEYLDAYELRSGPLFPSRERPSKGLSSNMIWRIVTEVHRRLGIRKNIHAYRKLFTSKLIEAGLNLLEVQQYTRHRDTSQLQVYYDRLDKAKTLDKYYAAFG